MTDLNLYNLAFQTPVSDHPAFVTEYYALTVEDAISEAGEIYSVEMREATEQEIRENEEFSHEVNSLATWLECPTVDAYLLALSEWERRRQTQPTG